MAAAKSITSEVIGFGVLRHPRRIEKIKSSSCGIAGGRIDAVATVSDPDQRRCLFF
jgi:hypothetical protein